MHEHQKEFTVVMRGPSAAIFWPDEKMIVKDIPSTVGPLRVTYATRWISRGKDVTVPGHLWIEVVGSGLDLETIIETYVQTALLLLPIISFSANAAITNPEIELAFESTRGITERDYFQAFVAPETFEIPVTRHVNVDATLALIEAHAIHPEHQRIFRSVSQYQIALDSWKMGQETFALAHLWMGVEALTKVVVRTEMTKLGLNTEVALAELLNIDIKQLDSTIRRKHILLNDEDAYTQAKAASDGFEHGYLDFGKIRSHASAVRERVATSFRNIIIEIISAPNNVNDILRAPLFNKPVGAFTIVKYLRGKLLGDSDKLGAGDNPYPFVRWKSGIKSCKPGANGGIDYTLDDTLTMEFHDDIKFSAGGFEAWKP
jgi:hypothetical protein